MRIVRSIVEWAAILLVALGATLLLTSGAAHAECAWVLWVEPLKASQPAWEPNDAFTSKADCEKRMVMFSNDFNRQHPRAAVAAICLPDTVDPRGPKQSGR